MTIRCGGALLFAAVLFLSPQTQADEYRPPALVKVQPVFFVPKREQPPTDRQSASLLRHLRWAQARYKELLQDRDTFTLADGKPQVCMAPRELAFYRQLPEGGAPHFVQELLHRDKCNRYNCPSIFVVVVMSPQEDYIGGGARPLNGGFNTGGGIVILTSYGLDRATCFQSTLQHELGHAFGLPHVDVYGYDMATNPSLMSYNPGHHTDGFRPSATPGAFIPEDIRGLALNRRVFPHLRFDPTKDCPRGYSIVKRIIGLGPMHLAGQPELSVTTTSGEANGSRVSNVVQGVVCPDEKLPQNTPTPDELLTFAADYMWQSDPAPSGWASLRVAFPFDVELTAVAIHSQHGEKHHPARAVRIAVDARGDKGDFRDIVEKPLASVDAKLSFPATKARTWQFHFKADESRSVVIRGLRFFSGDDEIFPSLLPWDSP